MAAEGVEGERLRLLRALDWRLAMAVGLDGAGCSTRWAWDQARFTRPLRALRSCRGGGRLCGGPPAAGEFVRRRKKLNQKKNELEEKMNYCAS
eukprot:COSAG04_NODE_1523_length_6469_cov_2.592465_4_plen_93_part_00